MSPIAVAIATALSTPAAGGACTTVLVGKALTADGSVIHAHNEDMGNEAAGRLWRVEEASHRQGETLRLPYVEIPQAKSTLAYWASGNVEGASGLGIAEGNQPHDSVLVGLNEKGVSLSCNWAHSREENREGVGIRRYALRQLLLERAESARHGVELLGELIETHGQADWGGLIYNLADSREAWVVETTTHNWVARRVRNDEIHITANRFRIGSDFDLASETLVSDAVAKGWLESAKGGKGKLDFAEIYGRPGKMDQAYDVRREERVARLLHGREGVIAPEDLFVVLRDRYEGTDLYTPPQEGSVWREDLEKNPELHRTISTNLAQSTFVAHLRSHLPVSVGAVMWIGMATPSYAGYFPLYAGGGSVPPEFSNSNLGDSSRSAWGLFRHLQRAADLEYERAYPSIRSFWTSRHALALESQRRIEGEALSLLEKGEEGRAARLLSVFSFSRADETLYHARLLLQLIAPSETPADPVSGEAPGQVGP